MMFVSKWMSWQAPIEKQKGSGGDPAKPAEGGFGRFAGAAPSCFQNGDGKILTSALRSAKTAVPLFALILKDGKWAYALPVPAIGRVTPEAMAVVTLARRHGFDLIADGHTLRAYGPPHPPEDLVKHLAERAADALAVLHHESDRRIGRIPPTGGEAA